MSIDKSTADVLDSGERDRLVFTLESRFAGIREEAATVVREAEQALEERERQLATAIERDAAAEYRSDPRAFMRDGLESEAEALERKTTLKSVRAGYRFLLDRAVDLAAAEVQGFRDDGATAEVDRHEGIEARRSALARAEATLSAAREMQARVLRAEELARQGLDLLVAKSGTG